MAFIFDNFTEFHQYGWRIANYANITVSKVAEFLVPAIILPERSFGVSDRIYMRVVQEGCLLTVQMRQASLIECGCERTHVTHNRTALQQILSGCFDGIGAKADKGS